MVGIVVGGGPAPGINGVISAATIEAVNHGKKVMGITGGFTSLFEGNKASFIPLTIEDVSRLHTSGGSVLRTSRGTPDDAKGKFKVLMSTLKQMGIKYLITIGGEGTLFMAHWIEREGRGSLNVVHTPKTIDNDIPLPGGLSTFGFQTARHLGVKIVNNLMEDARTMGRWYFVTTMGRHAGHLALGIGKASGATITLIPEEFSERAVPLQKVTDILSASIIKRLAMDRDHGVAILAEGIVDRLDASELNKCEEVELDSTGGIHLSDVQLGRTFRGLVRKNLMSLGLNVTIVDKTIGYELRAAPPIPFDIDYTRNLGYGAVRYLLKGGTGAMIAQYEGNIVSIPFVEMIDSQGNIKIRRVQIDSEVYQVARNYMIRVEKTDFEEGRLKQLAKVTNLGPQEFKARFSYIVDADREP
jgi:ATP-dependent phosphofructokinase / diphosphate-dependent phosphofructokinase